MKKTLLLSLILINLGWPIGAKYLIITHDNFYEAILPLAQWKHKKGVPTKVVTLSEIGATPSAISTIKNYIVNAYNNWNPRPEYVLLVGNGAYINSDGSKYDDYFANVTGDYKMDISLGRFPCGSASQCSLLVTKTLGYEKTPYISDSLWFRKGTGLIDEDNSSYPPVNSDTVYWNDVRYVANLWRGAGYVQVDSFSRVLGHNYTNVQNAINDGRAFLLYRGQSVYIWDSPFNLNPDNCNNGYKLPIVVSATCATITLSSSGYQGDKFMNAGTVQNPKGAVGYLGTSVVASGTGLARCRGTVAQHFYKAIFEEKMPILGDAFKRAKFMIDSIRPLFNGAWNSERYREWNLLGDPELNLWTNTPRQLTVLHDTIIYTGPQTYTVTVKIGTVLVPNALVCLMMNDSIVYEYGYTNSSGVISFSINPPTPGTMSVTVTAQNCIPYEKDVIIQPGGLEHDVSVYSIIEPIGTIASGITVYPKVKLINYGSHTDTFAVTFKIGSVYSQTLSQVILAAGDTVTKQFPGWTSVYGNYSIKAWTSLASDQCRNNDTAFGNLNVLYGKDVGIDSILCPDTLHVINTEMIPQVKVKNYGALAQSNFPVVCSIVSITGSLRYTNTQIISLGAQKDTIVNFSAWTPTITEKCSVKIRTALVGDANSSNDRKIRFTDIVPISQIVIGNGTATSRFPLDRYYNYSVHEAIYLQSEINTAGIITHIGYYKASGDDVNPIENVQIYLKHTEATTLATGTFSLDGYTLVFSGSFTNNATSGWMQVPLTTPFYYNNSDNLQILIRKGYQPWIYDYPQWCYTSTSPNYRTRQAYSDQNEPTNLTQTYNRPNIQLTLTTIRDVGIMAIISPTEVVADSQLITPKAIVKNLGYKPETLSVTFEIGNDYSNTITNFILNAGATDTAIFSTNWLATIGTYQIKCYLHLANNDFNPFNDTLQCFVTCRKNYENNFETTNGSFSALPATGGWEWGVPTSGPNSAHSGTKLWATVLAGNYTNNANWKLISSEFIATSDNPQLKFWHWYNMEESPTIPGRAYDGGNVKISTDSGLNWSLIRPINGYNGIGYTTNAGIPGESCYTGVHETWQQATFNLPVLSGQKFMVCWHFGSDGGVVRSGWYLDDIVCTEVVSRYPNDVGCLSIQAPISPVDSGAVITPVAIIHNYSLNRLSFDVKFDISDGYSNIRNISAPPNSDTMISFAPWTANHFGTFVMKCSTQLTLDENSFNDKATSNVSVRFHDVGVFEITSPRDSVASTTLPIIAKVKNFYIRTASCSTKFTIRNQNDSVIFEQKRFVANLLPESIQSINFGNHHLSPGKYYTKVWTILATDDNAFNDTLADSVKVLLAVPALNLPANFSVLYTATPFFDWSDVTGASEYQIQIDNDNNFLSPEVDTIVASSQLQIQPPGLSDDTFFWRVRAGLPYSFWSETRQFIINTAPMPSGWTQKEPIETSVPNAIKDGGAIVGVGNELYAFVGTKTNKFKKYTIGSKSGWSYTQSESLPFGYKYPTTTPPTINKKYPAKGAALCYDGTSKIYATRGNGTREFWSFNLLTRTWTREESIPVPKGVKGGTALAFNDGKVYLLAGGQKKTDVNNFYVYDTTTRHWSVSAPLTLGSYNKPWKDGSCLTVCAGQIYALKGGDKDNLFYAFNGTSWTPKETLPKPDIVFGSTKTKVVVKDGGCMASDGSVIYAIKGGGTDCFWRYSPSSGLWQRLESIPVIDKKHAPKTGAAMAYAAGRVWLLVGNKKPDFWCYTIGIDKTKQVVSSTIGALTTNKIVNAFKFNFDVTPNPFSKLTTIRYTVPVSSKVIIKLYNSSGRLIKTLVDNYQNAGAYSLQLDNLNNGIYFVRYQDINNRKEIKLIKL